MSRPSQGNRGRGRGGGAQSLLERFRDPKKKESPLPFPGRGLGSSSPISESGEAQVITERDRGAQAIVEIGEKDRDTKKGEYRLPFPGRGLASSSPISEDDNDKELLQSICQLHRQIRADHTPAKNIVSAIGELKTEIQNLISELDDSEENTEQQKKPAKSKPVDRKATESGTNNSKDLYTVATITKKNCRKLNSDLIQNRKEMKEISELAVAVAQEVGFQPDTSNVGKDSLRINAKEALENIKQRNKLSKLADNKMTEGNPNIDNLGDPNRPTKIAEVYSKIYDNEWTDALIFCHQKLRKEYNEDEALQALNKTLIICYKICQEKADEWMEKTKGVLERCSRELMVDIQSEEILMQIIEGRKVVSDQMSQQLLKEIRPKTDLVATKYAREMNSSKLCKMIIQNKFFEKCFTLCWKMIVQNPRMILVEGPSRGNTYDRNIFREFKSSGSKVVFSVWPALYLHEDGSLLVKGALKVE